MNRFDAAIQNCKNPPLLGSTVHRYNPDFVEIVGLLGFQLLWIEREHGLMSFAQAADLCRIAAAMGLVTMLRVCEASRDNVLKAAECGPDILDLPMVRSPQNVTELVRHSRYPPLGERGFFSSSRAVRYGLWGINAELHQRVNSELTLVAQVENRQAVENVEQICCVPGLDGIFIGLGDLSTSFGVPGETRHPDVQRAVERTLAAAKSHGKRILIPCAPQEVATWAARGACATFCVSDTACLAGGARQALETARGAIAGGEGSSGERS